MCLANYCSICGILTTLLRLVSAFEESEKKEDPERLFLSLHTNVHDSATHKHTILRAE